MRRIGESAAEAAGALAVMPEHCLSRVGAASLRADGEMDLRDVFHAAFHAASGFTPSGALDWRLA